MEGTDVSPWRKSTYSSNGGANCVEVGAWRKSSFSGGANGNCVEVGNDSDASIVAVRDTTNRDGGTLEFSASTWAEFVARLN